MRLSELALHAFALCDEAVALSQARLEKISPEPISCRKGCGACCRQVVPISAPEAFLLSEYVSSLPDKKNRTVTGKFRRILKTLEAEGMLDQPLFNHTGAYFALGMPCPFLVKESCSIHPIRPTVCREHLVLSPAEYCASFPDHSIRLMPMAYSVREALAQTAAEVMGSAPEMIPMASALVWSEANRSLGEKEWPAEMLRALLEKKIGRAPVTTYVKESEPQG